MAAIPILLGIGSTLLSNCFYLSTSYIIKNRNVVAGEITVFSAFLRILIFGSWATKVKCQRMNEQQPTRYSKKAWLSLIMSNLAIAVTILLSYICVTLLPLSDFIVFGFTSPVFTLLFAMAFKRAKVTLLNISMCLLIVIGTTLVAQPTFIFGESQDELGAFYNVTYTLGVVMALAASFINSFCPLLQANCKDMPMAYFMLWSGISKMIIGLLCPAFGLPNNLTHMSRFAGDFGVLTLVASASMLGLLFMHLAVTLSNNPLLVAVTRSMEIVMALVVDMITLDDINYHAMGIWYKVIGALIVTISVAGIALSDIIEERVPGCCQRSRDGYQSLDEEDSLISSETTDTGQERIGYGASQPRDNTEIA